MSEKKLTSLKTRFEPFLAGEADTVLFMSPNHIVSHLECLSTIRHWTENEQKTAQKRNKFKNKKTKLNSKSKLFDLNFGFVELFEFLENTLC